MEIALFALLVFAAWREYAHGKERAELLNRLQAPEVVIHKAIEKADPIEPEPFVPGPFTVVPDEDEAA